MKMKQRESSRKNTGPGVRVNFFPPYSLAVFLRSRLRIEWEQISDVCSAPCEGTKVRACPPGTLQVCMPHLLLKTPWMAGHRITSPPSPHSETMQTCSFPFGEQ